MYLEQPNVIARFWLHVRCHNCRKLIERTIDIPDVDDAPRSKEELRESGILRGMTFRCPRCDGQSGTVVAVKDVLPH